MSHQNKQGQGDHLKTIELSENDVAANARGAGLWLKKALSRLRSGREARKIGKPSSHEQCIKITTTIDTIMTFQVPW